MKDSFSTPILLIVFNRMDTTRLVFEQIRKVKPTRLYIAADGPRAHVPDEAIKCQAVRDIIKEVDWDCEIKTLFRDENWGCGIGVSDALTWFFNDVDKGIVLEDDCYPDISFFEFCQELLIKYQDDDQIKLISGTNFQNGYIRGNGSYYFTQYPTTWGWASWARAWKSYKFEITDMYDTFNGGKLDHVLRTSAEKKYWHKEFAKITDHKINIWDYQFLYKIWKEKGWAICPNVNLIKNLGFNNNASRKFLTDSIKMPESKTLSFPLKHPDKQIDTVADKYTFQNVYSHSLKRILRLVNENGIIKILKYILP